MLIRWATENDLPAWYELATEVSQIFQHPGDMGEELKSKKSGIGTVGRQEMLTAIDNNGKNMGFICFSRTDNSITWFAVSEKYRGEGVGDRLLKTAILQLDTTKDITVCTFTADDPQGAAARTLYKKYGFIIESPAEHNGLPRVEMKRPASNPSITCPNCGMLSKDEILLYNEKLRKQNFEISPILPTCKNCAAEVNVVNNCVSGYIIILNGTCGSGKSTIAEILAKKNFLIIDGDCVMQVVKHKKNVEKVDFNEQAVIDEIAREINLLSMFGDKIVLSHIIMPEDMDNFERIFDACNLKYQFFLLKPRYQIAVERCQTRTCHTGITPEQWIKYFYNALKFGNGVEVVDNTDMSAEETAEYVLQQAGCETSDQPCRQRGRALESKKYLKDCL